MDGNSLSPLDRIIIKEWSGGVLMHFLFFRAIKIPVFLIPVLIVGIVLGIMGYFYMSFHYSYRDTDAISWAVANKVIVVDAGHGGIDPGAVGPSGVLEKNINLAVAKRLCQYLSQGGAIVVMTREDDQCFA